MEVIKTTTLLLQAAASLSTLHLTLVPRAEPTITSDPWQCATENITQYFDPPKPTGSVLTALLSYADELYEDCTITDLPTGTAIPTCPFPDPSRWCAFTTSAPPSITPGYWAYGSSASSWWSVKSSKAESVASRCPNTWFKIMNETPGGATWLNDTIIFAECYEQAHPPTALPTHTETGGVSKVSSSGGSTVSTATPTATPAASSNNVVGRDKVNNILAAAGASIGVAAAGLIL